MNFKQSLASAKALAHQEEFLEDIIKMCALTPEDSYQTWNDEYGNSLKINKNGYVSIYLGEPVLNTSSDLLFKASPKKLALNSKATMLIFGKKDGKWVALSWFLCHDDRLRCSFFVEGKWKYNFCPLLSGIEMLRNMAKPELNLQNPSNLSSYIEEPIENMSIYKWDENIPEKLRNAWLHCLEE